jgi:hypothetical protein
MSGYLAVFSNETMVFKLKCRTRISGYIICFSETFKVKVQLQNNMTGADLELELKNTYLHNVLKKYNTISFHFFLSLSLLMLHEIECL